MKNAETLSMGTVVQWDPEQITTAIGGEVVAMSTRMGVYIGLDAAASDIWKRLEAPQSIGDLCDQLSREFQGDRDMIAKDVVELLTGLRELGMVAVTGNRDAL